MQASEENYDYIELSGIDECCELQIIFNTFSSLMKNTNSLGVDLLTISNSTLKMTVNDAIYLPPTFFISRPTRLNYRPAPHFNARAAVVASKVMIGHTS